jgi:4-amino-4-deoxy-L-arabinose transferase-like glycosyltransferase
MRSNVDHQIMKKHHPQASNLRIAARWKDRWVRNINELFEPTAISPRAQIIALVAILFVSAAIRIWTIGTPAIDRTHWKEIDYIEISKNYYDHGYSFLRPEVFWPAEEPRVTGMELPIVPFLTSLIYPLLGLNAFSVRFVPMISFLVLVVYVFLLARRELGPAIALIAAMVASVMPLYHPFGRVLFSEPTMIAASVAAVFHFDRWVSRNQTYDGVVSGGVFSLALALKPTAIYLSIPLLWIFLREWKRSKPSYAKVLGWSLAVLVLPVVWYTYAYYLEKNGVPYFSIFSGHDKFQTLSLLLNPDWYRTMYYRVGTDILGGKIGILLAIAGLGVALVSRRGGLFFAYAIAIGLFFIVVAEGQIDAPYRQLTSIPALSVFVALGALALTNVGFTTLQILDIRIRGWLSSPALFLIGAIVIFAVIPIRRRDQILGLHGYDAAQPVHPDRWDVAQHLMPFTNDGDLLVVMGEYTVHEGGNDLSPVLYYYTGLQGWTLDQDEWRLDRIDDLISRGATHFVAVPTFPSPSFPASWQGDQALQLIDLMRSRFPILYEDDTQLILDLQP